MVTAVSSDIAYEYGSFVLAHEAPAESSEWPALMSKLLDYLNNLLQTKDGGGWELVSHDFLTTGNELVVTFFIRRPKSS